MRILAALILALAAAGRPAQAHDYWANGVPVPAWVKDACCGQADSHLLSLDAVSLQDDGWHIQGMNTVVPPDHVLPSQDGQFWGFWIEANGPDASIYCFFCPHGVLAP